MPGCLTMSAVVDFVSWQLGQRLPATAEQNAKLAQEGASFAAAQRCGYEFLVTRLVVQRAFGVKCDGALAGADAYRYLNISTTEWAAVKCEARSIWHATCRHFEIDEDADQSIQRHKLGGLLHEKDAESAPIFQVLGGSYPLACFVDQVVDTFLKAEGFSALVVNGHVRSSSLLKYALTELVTSAAGGVSLCAAVFAEMDALLSPRLLTRLLEAAKATCHHFDARHSAAEISFWDLVVRVYNSRQLLLGDLAVCTSRRMYTLASGNASGNVASIIGKSTFVGGCLESRQKDVCVKEKELKASRQAIKATLTSALSDGRLMQTLAEVQKEKKLNADREAMKATFMSASLDGRLAQVLVEGREATKQNIASLGRENTQAIFDESNEKAMVQAMTLRWQNSRNAKALAELKDEKEIEIDPVATKAKLVSGSPNGRLAQPLAGLNHDEGLQAHVRRHDRLPCQANEELQAIRHAVKTTLKSAYLDGRLTQALADVKKDKEQKGRREDMKVTLTSALLDGRLNQALADVKKEKELKAGRESMRVVPTSMGLDGTSAQLQTIRKALKATLTSASLDGRLAQAFVDVKKEKELKASREAMKASLTSALLDGRLNQAIADVKKEKELKVAHEPMQASLISGSLDAKPTHVQAIRNSVRATLTSASLDGRLAQALIDVKREKDLKASREAMKATLTSALIDGRVNQALTDVKKEKELKSDRDAMKATLIAGPLDGRLTQAIIEVKKKKQIQAIRNATKAALLSAAVDGRLTQAFLDAKRDKELEASREAAKTTLTSALLDGRLNQAIADVETEKELKAGREPMQAVPTSMFLDGTSAQLQFIRNSLKATLTSASLDGRLAQALVEVKKKKELKASREAMKATLTSALLDGRLTQACADVKKEKELKAGRESMRVVPTSMALDGTSAQLQTIRKALKATLTSASLDGRLAQAFVDVKKEKELKASREAMKASLTSALLDGRLNQAFADVKKEKELKADREAMKATLISGSLDGQLARAIGEVKKERHLKAIRCEAKAKLLSALLDGRLTQLVDELKDENGAKINPVVTNNALALSVSDGMLLEARVKDIEGKELSADREATKSMIRSPSSDGKLTQTNAEVRHEMALMESMALRWQSMKHAKVMMETKAVEASSRVGLGPSQRSQIRTEGVAQHLSSIAPSATGAVELSQPTVAADCCHQSVASTQLCRSTPSSAISNSPCLSSYDRAVLPPRPPSSTSARPRRVKISRKSATVSPATFSMDSGDEGSAVPRAARESSLARSYEALGAQFHCIGDDGSNGETRSRVPCPPSPTSALPPVRAPSRRSSRSHQSSSAMSLDLGHHESSSSAMPLEPSSRQASPCWRAERSALSLDLGDCKKYEPSAMPFGLEPNLCFAPPTIGVRNGISKDVLGTGRHKKPLTTHVLPPLPGPKTAGSLGSKVPGVGAAAWDLGPVGSPLKRNPRRLVS